VVQKGPVNVILYARQTFGDQVHMNAKVRTTVFKLSAVCSVAFDVMCRTGSVIAERLTRRFVSVEMLSYCRINNANRSHVSLMGTFCNSHILVGHLHSLVTRIVTRRSTIEQQAFNIPFHTAYIRVHRRLTLRPIYIAMTELN